MKQSIPMPVAVALVVVILLFAVFFVRKAITGGVQGDGKADSVQALPPTPGGAPGRPPSPGGQ